VTSDEPESHGCLDSPTSQQRKGLPLRGRAVPTRSGQAPALPYSPHELPSVAATFRWALSLPRAPRETPETILGWPEERRLG
jgi:hypothetical protein